VPGGFLSALRAGQPALARPAGALGPAEILEALDDTIKAQAFVMERA